MTTPAAAPLRPSTPPVRLSAIVERIGGTVAGSASIPPADPGVSGITHDSRAVRPGDLYAALSGAHHHGAEFVDDVVARGAFAILTDQAGVERSVRSGLPTVVVDDVRAVLGAAASAVYGDPARELTVLGITGTNGKTTTAYLLEAAMRACGRRTGLIGTIATLIDGDAASSVRTTPEATDLHALLAVMLERGVDTVVMEVSSHALVMGRVGGVMFDVVGFTNLSQDHLDFHHSMDAYFAAKASLFTTEHARRGVVMLGTGSTATWGRRLVELATIPLDVVASAVDDTAALPTAAVVTVQVLPASAAADGVDVQRAQVTTADDVFEVSTRLVGSWNLENAVLAALMARRCDVNLEQAVVGVEALDGIRGRLERISSSARGDGPSSGAAVTGFVDFAHTPDAVDGVLRELRSTVAHDRRLVVVLGCGGDRDQAKRPLMGAAAARHADNVIVTDDNPRSEEPGSIRDAVLSGARAVGSAATIMDVGDRRRAIEAAVAVASPGGVVVVLGKGHESGQEVAGVITPFDDHDVLQAVLDAAASR